jgi:hypothetical protein
MLKCDGCDKPATRQTAIAVNVYKPEWHYTCDGHYIFNRIPREIAEEHDTMSMTEYRSQRND